MNKLLNKQENREKLFVFLLLFIVSMIIIISNIIAFYQRNKISTVSENKTEINVDNLTDQEKFIEYYFTAYKNLQATDAGKLVADFLLTERNKKDDFNLENLSKSLVDSLYSKEKQLPLTINGKALLGNQVLSSIILYIEDKFKDGSTYEDIYFSPYLTDNDKCIIPDDADDFYNLYKDRVFYGWEFYDKIYKEYEKDPNKKFYIIKECEENKDNIKQIFYFDTQSYTESSVTLKYLYKIIIPDINETFYLYCDKNKKPFVILSNKERKFLGGI